MFLGYKGAGKSAIGEHIRILAQSRHDLFVNVVALGDFPFTTFKRLMKGEDSSETKFPASWRWLLLLYLLDSFQHDNGGSHEEADRFESALVNLKDLGVLPNPDFKKIVLTSSKNSFSGKLKFLEGQRESTYTKQDVTDFPFFVEALSSLAQGFRSHNRHLLVIDGLDDILTTDALQLDALSSLIYETNRLNQSFAVAGCPCKIVILCRTDVFERLPGANLNKLRQDAAVNLDWYRDTREPGQSDLIRLINKRASLEMETEVDVFSQHLPRTLQRRSRTQECVPFLLDLTRHTPRDMIMLMKQLQRFAPPGMMHADQVLKGVSAYSNEYFLPEIKNELSGFFTSEHIAATIELIGSLRKREFSLGELHAQSKTIGYPPGMDLATILRSLFECSAIGNVDTNSSTQNYFTFRYRNRHSAFSINKKITLHFGVWKALNLA